MTLHLSAPPEDGGTPPTSRSVAPLDPLSPVVMAHQALGVLTTQAAAHAEMLSTKHERAVAAARAEALNTALRLVDAALANARAIQGAAP